MQCGFLAFRRDLNGHLCPMLITLESPGLSELGGWKLGPFVIQANGRKTFVDDLRSGVGLVRR